MTIAKSIGSGWMAGQTSGHQSGSQEPGIGSAVFLAQVGTRESALQIKFEFTAAALRTGSLPRPVGTEGCVFPEALTRFAFAGWPFYAGKAHGR